MRSRTLALALVALSLPAGAQQAESEGDRVSATLTLDVASAYFFRGIRQETHGVIVQPAFETSFRLFEAAAQPDPIRDVTLSFGSWNSLHTGPTGSRTGQAWYESDFYASVAVGLGGRFSASAGYAALASPNGSFRTVEELSFGLSFHDDGLWSRTQVGLRPSLLLVAEIDNQSDGGTERGWYLEIGVRPSFPLDVRATDLTLSVPVTIGWSLDGYYESRSPSGGITDSVFGYLDVGAVLEAPLDRWVPNSYGAWTLALQAHALSLGESAQRLNAGDDNELILAMSLRCSF